MPVSFSVHLMAKSNWRHLAYTGQFEFNKIVSLCMPKYKLALDEAGTDYRVIAIHSTIEAYELVFKLNKNLGLNFCRHDDDILFSKSNECYMVYKNIEKKNSSLIYLYSNFFIDYRKKSKSEELFNFSNYKINLVPELHKADYVVRHFGDNKEVGDFIKSVSLLNDVNSCYDFSFLKLKSKQNLIFD